MTEIAGVFSLRDIRDTVLKSKLRFYNKEVSHLPLATSYTRPIWRSSSSKYCPDEEGIETDFSEATSGFTGNAFEVLP
jgi:hypothetical protein